MSNVTHVWCRQCNCFRSVKWSHFKECVVCTPHPTTFTGMLAECEFCGLELAKMGYGGAVNEEFGEPRPAA